MGLISAANFCTFTDDVSKIRRSTYDAFDGAGAIVTNAAALLTLVLGLANYDQAHDMMERANTAVNNLTDSNVLTSMASGYYTGLNDHCQLRGVLVNATIVSILTYLAYYNEGAGGPWAALVSEDFAAFCLAVAVVTVPVTEVFATVTAGNQANPGMGRLTYGAPDVFLDGVAYTAGSTAPKICVATTVVAAGNVTVTVTGKNQAGVGSKTWTALLSGANKTAGAEVLLTPTDGTSRMTDVTAMSMAGGWTDGVVYVKPYQHRAY